MPGGFATPNTPNLADFLVFLESVQIPTAALPTDSVWLGYAFNQALLTVFNPPVGLGVLYTLAVYNLATHLLFMITPDQTNQTYFANARSAAGYNLISPAFGLVTSASDNGTSSTLTVPKWVTGMTIAQMEMFKTPWGRAYLAYAQSYGPTIVGLT